MHGAHGENWPKLATRSNPTTITSEDVQRGVIALAATVAFLGMLLLAAERLLPAGADVHVPTWMVSVRALFILPPLVLFTALAARYARMPPTIRPGALLASFGLTLWMAFQFAAVWLRVPYHVTLTVTPAIGAFLAAGVTAFLVGGVREAQNLRHRSEHDSLTGLLNRNGATRAWDHLPPNTPVALALIDLNERKKVNDQYGHFAGDTLLRTSADALARASHPHGWAARWGGDEFLVAFPRHSEARARDLLQQAAGDTSAPQGALPVWAIGITLATTDQPLDTALGRADAHMYADKAEHYDTVATSQASTATLTNKSVVTRRSQVQV